MIPCSYRASACNAVLPSYETLYVISIRQTRDLPVVSLFPHPASFRFAVACNTLAFGYILPTTGRIRDFHPLERALAGRTIKKEKSFDFSFNRQLLIFPGSRPPSIVSVYELNYCVRDGNRWNLIAIITGFLRLP